jgi:serine protease inhibitor
MPALRLLALSMAIALGGVIPASAAPPLTFAGFGIGLFRQAADAAPNGNVIVSPLSAGIALSMTYDGAVGPTAAEMAHTLGMQGMTPDEADAAARSLLRSLAGRQGAEFAAADSAWIDNSRPEQPLPSYVRRVSQSYDGLVRLADFRDPKTVGAINAWVSSATHGKITDLVDRLDAEAVLYLCNAIYFKGTWQTKFDTAQTDIKPFTLADGSTVQAARMSAARDFAYFETPGVQAVRLPYQGGFAMEVFLPSRQQGLHAFERDMTDDAWDRWQAMFSSRQGMLELPRFELHWKASLKPMLEAMGMQIAFEPGRAQFYAMYPQSEAHNIFIEDVVQATYLKVDEQGSEAGAATGVTMGLAAVAVPRQPPFSMIVDRPFVCAIVDERSGAPLFFAAVNDPR